MHVDVSQIADVLLNVLTVWILRAYVIVHACPDANKHLAKRLSIW